MSRSAPYHHGNLDQALLDAAMGQLERTGHPSLSLREVARAAGVSHNAPYHHFRDRTQLLQALCARAMSDLIAAQSAATRVPGTAAQRAIAVGEAYIHFAVSRPFAFAIIYDPEVCSPGAPTPEMAALIAENEVLLATLVSDILPPGAGIETVRTYAIALWATAHGLAQLTVAGHFPVAAAKAALQPMIEAIAPDA